MAKATVFIKGENQLGGAVKSAAKDLHSLTDTAKSITKTFSTAFGIGSAVAIIKKVTQVTKDYLASVKDPEIQASVSKISSSWNEIKGHMSDLVSYSIKPLFKKFDAGFTGIKDNIKSVGNYAIAIIKNLPEVLKIAVRTMGDLVIRTFQWDSLKTIFMAVFQNVTTLGEYSIKAIFDSIPTFLGNLFKGLGSFFLAVGTNLTASLLEAVENFLNSAKDKVEVSWFGKLFKVENWSEVDFGASKLKTKASEYRETADKAFSTAAGAAVTLFNDSVSTIKTIKYTTNSAMDAVYGDIIRTAWAEIKDVIEPTLVDIDSYIDDVEAAAKRAENLSKLGSAKLDISLPINWFDTINTLVGDLGLKLSPINEILASFYETLGSMLKTAIQPLHDVLSWIGSTLAKTLAPVLEVLGSWIQLIANILSTVLAPVLQVIGAVFTALAGVLNLLTPILKMVAEGFLTLMAPIQWLADLLSWLGSWVRYAGECVGVFIHNLSHPFQQQSYGTSPGKFTSTAFSGFDDRRNGMLSVGVGTSASVATSSASYQGATHVTINIYQEAPVVGDGGMRAFAGMIKNEFDAMAYYGV